MSVAMDAPVKEWSMTEQTEAKARDKHVKLILIHEEWQYRAHKYLDKNNAENRAEAKRLIDSGKWEVQSESALEVQLIEAKRRPICYACEYEGLYGPLQDFIYGKKVYINEVQTEVIPAHQRTWTQGRVMQGTYIAGPDSGPQLDLELNIDNVIEQTKRTEPEHYSEFRKITWAQMQTVDEEAKKANMVNRPHPESELTVKAK